VFHAGRRVQGAGDGVEIGEFLMALIERFVKKDMDRNSIHEGIEATYTVFERDGRSFMQIDSYGRSTRETPGKKSQSIQLDRKAGLELIELLKQAFHVD
jgi:hypothetical protein